jgi:hypothetical protein
MTEKTKKSIRICSIIALVSCILWTVYEILYFIGLFTGWGVLDKKVDWSINGMVKVVFFILYLFSTVALLGLCFKVIVNTLHGMREGLAFPQSNVKPLLWLTLADFLYRLCWMNQLILFQDNFIFGFTGSNLIMPFLLLFFAFMYKVAADAVEENNLTV